MRRKRIAYNDPDSEGYEGLALNDLTVWDWPDQTIVTGLLDQWGRPIKYDVPGMDPVGFIHFDDSEDEEEELSE